MWLFPAVVALATAAPDGLDDVVKALSARHAVPCVEVVALTTEPVAALLHAVDDVPRPPWAGMRAALCLLERYPEQSADELRAWVVDPDRKGLGRLTLSRVDALPMSLAMDLARRAVDEGPEPEAAKRRLSTSERPELRALAAR
ncbi:MAG: hypothetical protein KTR31_12450 [Myxococcales bacterium]|nr:hypothetical protein [Myxococcales bacterium]